MGITSVEILIKKHHEEPRGEKAVLLVDSGAVCSVVQRAILERLHIRPHRRRTFFLADGSSVEREIGDAYYEYRGVGGAAPVIVGETNDQNLLGTTTTEALELVLDPFQRELRPRTKPLVGTYPRGRRL